MPDPVAHKTLDLIARVDGKDYPIAQAVVPIYAEFDPKAEDLRGSAVFTVGDPVVEGYSRFSEREVKAKQALEQWKRRLESELNHPANGATNGNKA